MWFWQDQTKNEVDLLVEVDQKLHPIECKRKERPDASDLKGIRALAAFYGKASVGHAYVACLCERSFDITPGVTAVRGWTPWELGR